MSLNRTYLFLGFLLLLAAVLGIAYFKDSRRLADVQNENKKMSFKIAESERKQKDAIIQKRISEQLEEIAQQQKLVTENQKTIALEQRSIAEQKQYEAVVQKQLADKAKDRAEDALKDAQAQKKIALREKEAAEKAEKNANRLRKLSLGQSLSARSINQNNSGNEELATMLALAAWQFISENKGNLYQAELYQALKLSSKEENTFKAHQGVIRDLKIMPGSTLDKVSLVSADQNGEVIFWTGTTSDLEPTSIWRDENYDLREISFSPDGKNLAISDATGNIIVLNQPFKDSEQFVARMSDSKVKGLNFISNTEVAFVDKNNIISLDIESNGAAVQQFYNHKNEIVNLVYLTNQSFYFSDVKGGVYEFNPTKESDAKTLFEVNDEVSSICVEPNKRIVAGTASGKIYVYDFAKQSSSELVGHISQVNDLVFTNELLISTAYDKTVRLWNLDGSTESIIIDEQNDWGFCLALVPESTKIISAGAGKQLRITSLDPNELAKLVNTHVKRDFTQEEWNTYVDPALELKSFKRN